METIAESFRNLAVELETRASDSKGQEGSV